MALDFNSALSQYNAAAKRVLDHSGAITKTDNSPTPSGSTFTDMVKDVVTEAVDAGRQSERLNMEAMNGKADVREVAIAVANAEIALETVITVRDKVMSAYQQIIKMQV